MNNLPSIEIVYDVAVEEEISTRDADYHYDKDEDTSQWFMNTCQEEFE